MNAASTAFASDCETSQPLHPKAQLFAGETGVWLSEPDANRVFFVLSKCVPEYKSLIAQQAVVIDLSAKVIATSSTTMQTQRDLVGALIEQNDYLKAQVADSRSGIDPAIAFMGGSAITAAVIVVLLLVVKAVD